MTSGLTVSESGDRIQEFDLHWPVRERDENTGPGNENEWGGRGRESLASVLLKLTFCVTVFVVFDNWPTGCEARKKSKPPLIEERPHKHHHNDRLTHCPFGNETHEVGAHWKPNLQPFGVYYCIRCECISVQRKNRNVAKVRCKNLKNDCPKPTCDDPVLLPERCCKTCPGDEEFAESTAKPDLNKTLAVEQPSNQTNSETPDESSTPKPLSSETAVVGGDDESGVQKKSQNDQNSQNNLIGEPTHKCYYEAKIYEEGSQWKTERDDCEMCFCQL
ncbi:unnamed protein product [Medioppia subpectinata]|uniref:Chordin n=1 Tax=Medioppia subpectinata TaxID=1979941 RepID=A0A7R9Q2X2_9ACAR|nr:unnamed protein product [Medioppia subpectinata]CAG2109876.1 unnamed protein product [Medioppia subpectinata]